MTNKVLNHILIDKIRTKVTRIAAKIGDVVKVEYVGQFEDGAIFDSSDNHGGSIKIHLGTGQVLRSLEKAIVGMNVGDEKTEIFQPSEAFGEFNPLLLEKVEISTLPADMSVEIGKYIEMVGPNGVSSPGWIRFIDKDYVIVDMNHPYAGKVIRFKIKLIETGLEPDSIQNPFSFGTACDCNCNCNHPTE
ncbi:MAG TPA: FKBP-type peptidyl-prolyl cis-trans isomerase [Candidatus Lokiarchaeia archaeon]